MSQVEQKRTDQGIPWRRSSEQGYAFPTLTGFVNALKGGLRLRSDFFSLEQSLGRFEEREGLGDPATWLKAVERDPEVAELPSLLIDRGAGGHRLAINVGGKETELPVNGQDKVSNSSLLYSLALSHAKLELIKEVAPEAYAGLHGKLNRALKQIARAEEELLAASRKPEVTRVKRHRSLRQVFNEFITQQEEPNPSRRKFLRDAAVVTGALVLVACAPKAMTTPSETVPGETQTLEPTPELKGLSGLATPEGETEGGGAEVEPTETVGVDWASPNLEQAGSFSRAELPPPGKAEESFQLMADLLPRELGNEGIEVGEVEFYTNHEAEPDYRWIAVARDTQGNIIWSEIERGGNWEIFEYPYYISPVVGGGYHLVRQNFRFMVIPDSEGAQIVWGGKQGDTGVRILPIPGKDLVSVGGREVEACYLDRATGEWRVVPELAEMGYQLVDGELVQVSPELQSLEQEMKTAGISNYRIEGNEIYWVGDGSERKLRVRIQGNEAELFLHDGQTARVEASRLRVNTREETLPYVHNNYDYEHGIEQISNIVVVNNDKLLFDDQTGQWFEYVLSNSGEVWQLAEDIPLGVPDQYESIFTIDFSGIRGEIDVDMLEYTMINRATKIRAFNDQYGWPKIGESALMPGGLHAFDPFNWTRLWLWFERDNYRADLCRIITGSGKEMLGVTNSGEISWRLEEGGRDSEQFIANWLIFPEAGANYAQATDGMDEYNDKYSAEAVFRRLQGGANEMFVDYFRPFTTDEANVRYIDQQGWQPVMPILERSGFPAIGFGTFMALNMEDRMERRPRVSEVENNLIVVGRIELRKR